MVVPGLQSRANCDNDLTTLKETPLDEDLKAYLEEMETRLNTRIERVETKLLTAFHDSASPVEMRVRSHSAVLRALDLEQESLADRVTKLERPATS